MARFAISTLLALSALFSSVALAQNNPYIAQIPQCAQACVNAIIANQCGSSEAWTCACKTSDYTGPGQVTDLPDCKTALQNCPSNVYSGLPNQIVSICTNDVLANGAAGSDDPSKPSGTASGSAMPASSGMPSPSSSSGSPSSPSPSGSPSSPSSSGSPSSPPAPAQTTGGANVLGYSPVLVTGSLAFIVAMFA